MPENAMQAKHRSSALWFIPLLAACTERPPAPAASGPAPPAASVPAAPADSAPAASAPPTSAPPTSAPPAAAQSFEAVLRIDSKPGGKHFQGVWLEREDGQKWVVSYRADPWWRPFEDERVRVEGETYSPEGQAVLATHFRPRLVRVVDPKAGPMRLLIEIHEERVLDGRFQFQKFPPGSKLAGESHPVFAAADGREYQLANSVEPTPPHDEPVRIRAREVVFSPYAAHVGGPALWVVSVEER
jgi:hypothetical protein